MFYDGTTKAKIPLLFSCGKICKLPWCFYKCLGFIILLMQIFLFIDLIVIKYLSLIEIYVFDLIFSKFCCFPRISRKGCMIPLWRPLFHGMVESREKHPKLLFRRQEKQKTILCLALKELVDANCLGRFRGIFYHGLKKWKMNKLPWCLFKMPWFFYSIGLMFWIILLVIFLWINN